MPTQRFLPSGRTSLDSELSAIADSGGAAQLDLTGRDLGLEGVQAVASILPSTPIASMFLARNNIRHKGALVLGPALAQNSSLTHLYLSHNDLGPEGAGVLARCLSHHATLSRLNLSNNGIGPKGAEAVAEALKDSGVEELCLDYNELGPQGGLAIAKLITRSRALKELSLWHNFLGREAAIAIARALEGNTTLTALDMRGENELGKQGVQALEAVLTANRVISAQHFSYS